MGTKCIRSMVYLKDDGTMSVGWTLVNGKWYYTDTNGFMTTGLAESKWKMVLHGFQRSDADRTKAIGKIVFTF